MKNYKIYVYNNRYNILISEFNINNNITNPMSIFNENLSEQENSQYELTFSLSKYIYNGNKRIINNFFNLLQIGSQLKLEIDNGFQIILFTIKNIAPEIYSNNIIYNYTAQDIISYNWAKRNIGYSYSTEENPQNIFNIAKQVLIDNNLYPEWDVKEYESEDAEKMTLIVDNSNPYNVIIEACNTIGYNLKVDFKNKLIDFYNKKNIEFSGYRYYPEINLNSLSASYNGENLVTMLHILGGENEYGEVVTMMPAIPSAIERYLIEYFNIFSNGSIYYDNLKWNSTFEGKTIKELIEEHNFFNSINKEIQKAEVDDEQGYYSTYKYKCKYYDEQYPEIELDSLYYYEEDSENNNLKKLEEDQYITKIAIVNNGVEKYVLYKDKNLGVPVISDERQNELEEIDNFCKIADQNPHLSQFITDFSFFIKNKMMTSSEYDEINKILNDDIRVYNLVGKILIPKIYEAQYQIAAIEAEAKTYAEMYGSNVIEYIERLNEDMAKATDLQQEYENRVLEQLNNIRSTLSKNNFVYFKYLYNIYTKEEIEKHFDEIYTEQKEYYIEKMKLLQDKLSSLQTQLDESQSDPNALDWNINYLKTQIDAIESQLKTIRTLTGWNWKNPASDEIIYNESIYDILKNISLELLNNYINNSNIINYKKLNDYNDTLSKQIISTLYKKYGSYIYEASYENTDELDSVSLYNQGLIYFEEQKYPTADYNISVLDMSRLELVSIPNLQIGTKIKVYNPFLNLSDGEWDPNTQSIKEDSDLCDIQFKNNDLIVTGLTYSLRNSSVIEVSVEQVNNYQKTLEKLLLSVAKK